MNFLTPTCALRTSNFPVTYTVKGSILRYREDGALRLLIKEQRDYHGRFKVYFRMSVAQFDGLLAILEPRIKKKTTSFCELSVQGSIYIASCCEMKWMNLTIAILDFGIRLYRGSEQSKHLSKCLLQMRKKQKNEPDPIFFMTDKNFGGSV